MCFPFLNLTQLAYNPLKNQQVKISFVLVSIFSNIVFTTTKPIAVCLKTFKNTAPSSRRDFPKDLQLTILIYRNPLYNLKKSQQLQICYKFNSGEYKFDFNYVTAKFRFIYYLLLCRNILVSLLISLEKFSSKQLVLDILNIFLYIYLHSFLPR